MSGFAAAVSTGGGPPDQNLLERMVAKLAFRGPDGTNVVAQNGAGFCFTLMRTGPAPQVEKQPHTIDGKVWLLGDVRLDGRDELRRKLEQFGHTLAAGVTDEELVLHAWQQWGEAGLPDLLGDYSLGLWDSEARRLWCVRDLMGARPFFYAQANGWLYFSNTLATIRCVKEISSELDLHYLGDFLLEGSCHYPERSVFRDIARLPAGHMLRFSDHGLDVRRFSSIPIDEPLWLKREEDYVERFRALLEQAVRDRLPHGPAAIFMSGGLDSTGVAATAMDVAKKDGAPLDLRAYTMDWNPLFKDLEGELAMLAANFIGIPIEILNCSGYLPFGGWETSPPPLPEPFHEPFRAIYIEQVGQISKHARVVFNGYGGDGVMSGLPWPHLINLARSGLFSVVAKYVSLTMLKEGRIHRLFGGFRKMLRIWLENRDVFAEYPTWLSTDYEYQLNLRNRWRQLRSPSVVPHKFYPQEYTFTTGAFWPTVTEADDMAWTGFTVESRAPMLDVRLQSYLFRIPPLPLCLDKQIFRKAMRGLLPDEIRGRPKSPLGGDAVVIHSQTGGWNSTLGPTITKNFDFVFDREKLEDNLRRSQISFPWAALRPASLLYWESENSA